MKTEVKKEQEVHSSLFSNLSNMGHEQIVYCHDSATGLKAIIGIHSTVLGPALGGTRVWRYTDESSALNDVLRLSRGMSFKSAISGLNLGGGKAVIIDDEKASKNESFWRRYGRFVESLNGKYITAEDVGTSPKIMEYIATETKYAVGLPAFLGGGGDPSPVTAYGVYLGIKAAAKHRWGKDSLLNKVIAVQGVGHVGQYLVGHLVKEGAIVKVCDINEKNLKETVSKYGVEVIGVQDVYTTTMDIYAPCALGATLNDETIPLLRSEIVAGAANNQLKDEKKHGQFLVDRNILYIPDFLINAGGVCNCFAELNAHGYNREYAYSLAEKIYDRAIEISQRAEHTKTPPQLVAMQIAQERIDEIAILKSRQ